MGNVHSAFLVQMPLNCKPSELVSLSVPVRLASAAVLESARRARGAGSQQRRAIWSERSHMVTARSQAAFLSCFRRVPYFPGLSQTSSVLQLNPTVFPSPQVLGLKLPNLLGRAEKVTFQFSYGTKETSYGLSFFKPQPGRFERK